MISYLNGKFKPNEECFIHIEDRGSQFADAVYEVILIENNKIIDLKLHLERLFYSLSELLIVTNITADYITKIIKQLLQKNNLHNGSIYIQISRGYHGDRSQINSKNQKPTFFCRAFYPKKHDKAIYSVKTFPDLRWGRCDIKSTALAYSSFCKTKAIEEGFDDALLIKNEYVTECSFANFFFVNNNNQLITRNTDQEILNGVTRKRIIKLAKKNSIAIVEKKFNLEEILSAKECFMTSSTLKICPIGKIDNSLIFNGKIGKITKKIHNLYQQFIQQ